MIPGWEARITCFSKAIPKALRNSDEHQKRRVYMNDHDLVSSGFLALAAAGLVLLGSSLLAIAFA